MKVNNISLVDPPNEPRSPIRPRVIVNLSVGVLLGLLVGIILATLREFMDSSIKTPEDVEKKLGVTFLGLLPEIPDDKTPVFSRKGAKSLRRNVNLGAFKPELIVHERPLSGIAEAARSIRTNLMFLNPDTPYRTILVSSAAPSEGKTTIACTIAIALAQGGHRVCIIDCDLRRPRLHKIFDRFGDLGVTNVLIGESTIEEAAKATGIDNLSCIPAGPIPPNAADILHSEKFKQFIKDVGQKFDRVIIDSPPIVAVTDAAIISTVVDGTVYVLRAFSTSKALSRQGLRSLRDVGSKLIGTVLNAVDLNKHEYSYYYHYYYYKKEGYLPHGLTQDNVGVVAKS
jgi:succinoglycan biosynthesis transport protein ExoP